MKSIRTIVVTVSLVTTVFTAPMTRAEPPKLRPGLWETTVNMEMVGAQAGMPKMPAKTERRCVHKGDVDDSVPQQGRSDCDVKKNQKDANTISWTVKCTQKDVSTTGHGQTTIKGDTSTGFFEITMTGGPRGPVTMKTTFESRRLGGC